jgi:hypothetical protein
MSTQPTERDLSYRTQQRAASVKVRGELYARSGITPEAAPRRIRRALSALARHNAPLGVTVKATSRLLGCDPLTARDFLARCGGLVTTRNRPRVVAFNHNGLPPVRVEVNGEELESTQQSRLAVGWSSARNAAKAERRARARA